LPSQRSLRIAPFIAMDVLERAKALEHDGADIIHMEIGEPDFETPVRIRKAAAQAIHRGETHYTHSCGIRPLREAVAAHYRTRYGVDVSPEQVIVTMGTSQGLLLVLSALVDPGDGVIVSNPGYACYPNFLRYVDAEPIPVTVRPEEGFALNADRIRAQIGPRTTAILVNSPANPTGTVLTGDQLREITDLGLHVVSDEIYHGLVYGAEEHTILEYTTRAFVLNGFSKLYAMTGWRLGYIIAPDEFVRPIQKLQQNLFICASSVSQWAGVSALTDSHPELAQMVATYDERRKFTVRGLRELGFGVQVEPRGAFYVLADARGLGCVDSFGLAFDILDKAGVAVAPGVDFGTNAEGFLRFSYANSLGNIERAFERLEVYLKTCLH